MIELSCHCGAVCIEVRTRPEFLHECNCTLCSKTGASWGYFAPEDVTVAGHTTGYSRSDKPEPAVAVHFCPTCGSTTHFRLTPAAVVVHGDVQMGVNMRLADQDQLAGVELRFPDGRRWPGTGSFGYVRDPLIIG
jgi:hypothetical protein